MAYSQYAARMKTPEKQPLAADAEKFIVRLPHGMRDRIAEAAKANGRSMNAEIVARLQNSFLPSVTSAMSPNLDMDQFVDELASRLAEKLRPQ